jgi:hypothetical protein
MTGITPLYNYIIRILILIQFRAALLCTFTSNQIKDTFDKTFFGSPWFFAQILYGTNTIGHLAAIRVWMAAGNDVQGFFNQEARATLGFGDKTFSGVQVISYYICFIYITFCLASPSVSHIKPDIKLHVSMVIRYIIPRH